MKSKLVINNGDISNYLGNTNNTSNYLSKIKNRSLTTNESDSVFSSQYNSIATNTYGTKNSLKKSFMKSKSSLKFPSKSIFKGNNSNNDFIIGNIFLPKISSNKQRTLLLKNADQIVKERNRHYIGRRLKQTKSSILIKSKEICLNNFLITQLKDKRTEINDKQTLIFSKLQSCEKKFELDYKNFIDFVEKINKKEKEEEEFLNGLKNISKNIEEKLMEQLSLNKNLEMKVESLIKRIIVLQNYGSFLHKVFYKSFVFDELKKINLKGIKYLSLSDTIISLYKESIKSKMFEDIYEIIIDDELLMDKFIYFENKVVKILKEKEELEQEKLITDKNYKNTLAHLNYRKDDCEKELYKYQKEKREINNTMSDYTKFDYNNISETQEYLDYIIELGNEVGIDMKKIKSKINNQNQIIESTQICKETLNLLEQKEFLVNSNIKFIENIIKYGNEQDKGIIESQIYERKKFIKKGKQAKLREMQEREERNKALKAIEKARKIVLEGRKVFPDIPLFKHKNKNKKYLDEKNIEEENYEYLKYSSEED